ncbi:DinB family protein [Micromonospora sp. C95]|uniref:DinB family protein n=1 Tax=Micromonospora sp. C95 TaxID=2824882 RepID=UPI002657531D|nr:DinB family protein [Micromonospora sp. C95]
MVESRPDPVAVAMMSTTADERAVLDSFLDFHRAMLLRKLRGVSDAEAARRLVPSATTLAGLVKHLTLVERNWFRCLLAPGPGDVYLTSEEDATASFTLATGDTVERLSAAYEAECARSREVAARFDLDHVVPHPQLGEVSVRWILVHLIEETARHVGHADILRELTDGSTGAI